MGQIIINGEVRGTIQATDRIEVHNRGRVFGTILAPVLIVEEGAYIEASCQTKGSSKATGAPPKEQAAD